MQFVWLVLTLHAAVTLWLWVVIDHQSYRHNRLMARVLDIDFRVHSDEEIQAYLKTLDPNR